jgi:C1A family cysteine protease
VPIFPTARHGFGHLPDREDVRDDRFTAAFGADRAGGSLDMRGLAPVLDQGGTSSCVAHAVATAILIREAVAGVYPIVPPSRLALYWNARYQHGGQRSDSGTYIREAFKVLAKIGVPHEALHPFSTFTLTVNRQPPIKSYIEGHKRSGGRYVRIDSYGSDRIADIRAALRNRLPVVFGTLVSEDFLRLRGNTVAQAPTAAARIAGGHAMVVVGDDPQRGFIVQNSWGRGWGDNGYCVLSYDYVTSGITRDLWCVDGWKRIARAA